MRNFLIIISLLIFSLVVSLQTCHAEDYWDENNQQQEQTEALPNTNILDNNFIRLGIASIVISLILYKVNIDVAKMRKKHFEDKILEKIDS